MNAYEGQETSLKEKIFCKLGEQLARIAIEPRSCWNGFIYEPEIPPEILKEMAKE